MLSSHLLLNFNLAVVAPLLAPTAAIAEPLLSPGVSVEGASYTLAVPLLASIRRDRLKNKLGDVSAHADEIDRAVHRLFTGF